MRGPFIAIFSGIVVILLLTGTLILPDGWRQNAPLLPSFKIDNIDCPVDFTDHLCVIPRQVESLRKNTENWAPIIQYKAKRNAKLYVNGQYVKNSDQLIVRPGIKSLPVELRSGNYEERWTLYFTTLPVIDIIADVIEPHVNHMGMMRLIVPGFKSSPEYLAIKQKIRGRSALRDPKRPLRISLFRQSRPLLGMRNDDDWILDALWTDPSYIRNRLVFDLFRSMQGQNKTIGNASPDGRLVELFLNNRYYGLFVLMEMFDRKLLNLEHNGVIYKAINSSFCDFNSSGPTRPEMQPETGFFIKHPKPYTDADFDPLRNLIGFIANSNQDAFDKKIGGLMDINNLIDHTLLIWAAGSRDNLTHNFYMAKNPSTPIFMLPWDNEISFGCNNEEKRLDPKHRLSDKANRLQQLLLKSPRFRTKISKRWKELRKGLFSSESLVNRIIFYKRQLIDSGAADRDRQRWERENIGSIDNEFDFMKQFIEERMIFLDNMFLNKK